MHLQVCGSRAPSQSVVPQHAAAAATQPVRTHRRHTVMHEPSGAPRIGLGRPVATRVAIEEWATDLEEVASQGEISYHPDVPLIPTGNYSRSAGGAQASVLPKLLATWDKAVQRRNQELLTKMNGQAAESSTSPGKKGRKHKKQGWGGSSAHATPDQQLRQALSSDSLTLYKGSNLVELDLPDVDPDVSNVHPQASRSSKQAIGVHEVMQWFANEPPAFMQGHTLAMIAEQAPLVVLHVCMKLLGSTSKAADVERLLLAILAAGRENTHTWSTAFIALADAGYMHTALRHVERACKEGRDIGPAGASSLIWLASRSKNIDLGLELYYKLCSMRTTFNRYMFNCLLHLCALVGRVNDALDVLTHMRAEAAKNVDCKPDAFTYSALLRAVGSTRRWELLNLVFFSLLEDKVEGTDEVWGQLMTGAGKAGRHEWAMHFFKGYRSQLGARNPSLPVINAYLLALCRSNHVQHMMTIYHQMPSWGLKPDSYTYVALLTGMARSGASLQEVQGVLRQMRLSRLMTTTELGTALLNAYRRTPEIARQDPDAVQLVLENSGELMMDLVGRRMATSRTYTVFASLHIQVGRADMVQHILADAAASGCVLDHTCYHHLHLACLDSGLTLQAEQFVQQRNVLRMRAKAVRRAVAEREARFKAWAAVHEQRK